MDCASYIDSRLWFCKGEHFFLRGVGKYLFMPWTCLLQQCFSIFTHQNSLDCCLPGLSVDCESLCHCINGDVSLWSCYVYCSFFLFISTLLVVVFLLMFFFIYLILLVSSEYFPALTFCSAFDGALFGIKLTVVLYQLMLLHSCISSSCNFISYYVMQNEDEDMSYMYNGYLHKLMMCFLSHPITKDKVNLHHVTYAVVLLYSMSVSIGTKWATWQNILLLSFYGMNILE